ncbi:MAG: winged helix-turn-helix domain-containing protein [Blautia wexlerae]
MQYILEQGVCHGTVFNSCHTSFAAEKNPLTEIQEGELYLCLEHRTVRVRERMINLTSKEFDILALLIANPKRVFTYELITDLVWKEDCDFYSRKAIHNHMSKLRKKLRFEPDLPNYIESVAGSAINLNNYNMRAVAHVTAPLLFVESKNKKHVFVEIKACATDFLENQKFSMDL